MSRLRKKQNPHVKVSSRSARGHEARKVDRQKSTISKQQILTSGGDEEDYNLVNDVEDAGSAEEDPALSKDVSKIIKGLKLDSFHPTLDGSEVKVSKKNRVSATAIPKYFQHNDVQPVVNKADKGSIAPATNGPKAKPNFVVEPTSQWYTLHPALTPVTTPMPDLTPTKLATLTTHAANLHADTVATYQSQSSSTATTTTSDFSFLQKILQSGTLSDRLSALTLLVQSSPVHNAKALETLKTMAERGKGKGGREESLKALRCIVDWWVGGGVPNRKLKYFRDQPLLHSSVTDQHLLLWYFEDWLKKFFFSILQVLETLSLDPLPYVRTQALSLIFTLLRDKPEQEHNLLRLLVNKLGDNEKSLCSRASYHLLQLVQSHPSMKSIIVREITSLVLRPPPPPTSSISSNTHIRFNETISTANRKPKPQEPKKEANVHARYYATITYNQIVLAPGDREVALQLIDVYFEIFKELLGEGNSGDEVKESGDKDDGEKGEKGHVGAKGKAKAKETKGEAGFVEMEDEHSKLISAILTGVNRALPFAKISSTDVGLNKHIDTLFLITHTSTFNISLQSLLLIQQISSSLSSPSNSITNRYYRTLYASLHDPRLASSSKQAMYLNLLFKSLKVDNNNERVKAFVRRFVQVLGSGGGGGTEFVAGGLYLLGELFSKVHGLRQLLSGSLNTPDAQSHDEYDPRKREPQFAHPSSSPLWELVPLAHHYHPTVSLHARQLLSSQPLTASADLSLNTLSHFLDRFVYKNPKKPTNAKPKGASAMQPAASTLDGTGVKLMRGEVLGGPLNAETFWKKRVEDIPVDQLFFHRFFSRRNEKEIAKASKVDKRKEQDDDLTSGSEEAADHKGEIEQDSDKDASDAENNTVEEDSDAEEAEIWKAMRATFPKETEDSYLMENSDSDDLLSGIDDHDDDDQDAGSNSNDGNRSESLGGDFAEPSDVPSLDEGWDNDDLVNLDDDIPEGLIDYDDTEAENDPENEDEWTGFGGGQKRKRGDAPNDGGRKKKLRSLPTFASYEDYAKIINDGPDDHL